MTAVLRLIGLALLMVFGLGAGAALYHAKLRRWQAIHSFVLLLEYLHSGVRYRGAPCAELLREAADNAMFAPLALAECRSFCDIPIPPALADPYAAELNATLLGLERTPMEGTCAGLLHMIELCRAADDKAHAEAARAGQLYPKLGLCLALLAAVALA